MNRTLRRTTSFALTSIGFALAACNSDTADDTALEPSRASRIESLAETACDRYSDTSAGCPGYGTASNQKYADATACENDFKQKAENLWPVDKCDNGRIDATHFDTCVDRAKNYACSTGGQSVLDGISALDDCSAAKVCTDTP
jgi:hypothetical protein